MKGKIILYIQEGERLEEKKSIDRNEFYTKMENLGETQQDHMAKTLCGLIPSMQMIIINPERNEQKDIPFIAYMDEDVSKVNVLNIQRHHKDIWLYLNDLSTSEKKKEE